MEKISYKLVLRHEDGSEEVHEYFELDELAKTGDTISVDGKEWTVAALKGERGNINPKTREIFVTLLCVPRG